MGDRPGRVDSRDQHPEYRLGHALNAAIGQGTTMVTVLQMALAYAAIANRGTLYYPQILHRVESAEGGLVREIPPDSTVQRGHGGTRTQARVAIRPRRGRDRRAHSDEQAALVLASLKSYLIAQECAGL